MNGEEELDLGSLTATRGSQWRRLERSEQGRTSQYYPHRVEDTSPCVPVSHPQHRLPPGALPIDVFGPGGAPRWSTVAPFQNVTGPGYPSASGLLFPTAFEALNVTGGDAPYPTVSGPMYPAASDADYPMASSNLPLAPNDSSDSSTASTTAVATPIMPKPKLILPAPPVPAGWLKAPAAKKKSDRERYIPSKMPKVGGHGVWTPYRHFRLSGLPSRARSRVGAPPEKPCSIPQQRQR